MPMCERVALTACARSSLESISVPSRSKISRSMSTRSAAPFLPRLRRRASSACAAHADARRPTSYVHHFPLQRIAMNAELLGGRALVALVRSSAPWIMLFSRTSMACCRKSPPSSRCSTSPSNLSFIFLHLPVRQVANPFVQRIAPGCLHLGVGLPEALSSIRVAPWPRQRGPHPLHKGPSGSPQSPRAACRRAKTPSLP